MSLSTLITHERLEKLAGKARYDLGCANAERLPIENFSLENESSSAIIDGFKLTLSFHHDTIECACDCPESDGFEFCEHGVQLALHTHKISQQMLSLSKGPDKSKVLAYLLSLDKQDLAKQMLAILEQDKESFQHYLLKASMSREAFDWKALRKELTQITKPQSKLFSQRQVKAYFAKIEAFLRVLSEGQPFDSRERFQKLLEYAVKRLNDLLRKMEDRSEERAASVELLRRLFDESVADLGLPGTKKAAYIFEQWSIDHFSILGRDPGVYLEKDAEALEEFISMLSARWFGMNKKARNGDLTDIELKLLRKISRYLLESDLKNVANIPTLDLREVLIESENDYIQIAIERSEQDQIEHALALLEKASSKWPSSLSIPQLMFDLSFTLELSNEADREHLILSLCRRFPEALAEKALGSEKLEGLKDQFIEFLLKERPQGTDAALLGGLVDLERYDEIETIYSSLDLRTETRLQFAPNILCHKKDLGLSIYNEELTVLFNKQMLSADKKAAQVVHQLERLCQQLSIDFEPFASWVRTNTRGRNKFTETYRALVQS